MEFHASDESGWIAGASLASTRIDPYAPGDAELGVMLGYTWDWSEDFSSRLIASHYRYPWNDSNNDYDYTELGFDLSYRGWLSISATWSPDMPRHVYYRGLISDNSRSLEANLQSSPWHRLTLHAGTGYSRFAGPGGAGYFYWSAGAALDMTPFTLSAGFVDTGSASTALFQESAAHHRWMAALLWRF